MVSRRGQCDASAVSAGTADAAGAWATGPACCGAASRPGSEVQAATTANVRIDVRMSRMVLPNGSRLSCGALKKDSFPNLRAPPASSACYAAGLEILIIAGATIEQDGPRLDRRDLEEAERRPGIGA